MRLFIAIKLPVQTVNNLEKIQSQLRPYAARGSFTPPVNLHVTLKFLGEVYADKLYTLYALMDELKSMTAPTMSIQQVSTLRAADIVCAKLKCDQPTYELERLLTDRLEAMGFTIERRIYVPHVTLMRRYAFSLPFSEVVKNVTVFNKPFVATEIALYSSALSTGNAPTYTELYSVNLQPPTE